MNYAHALLIDEARCPFRTNNLPLFPRPLLAIIGTISFRRRNRKKGDELIEVTLVPQADTWEIQRLRARMEAGRKRVAAVLGGQFPAMPKLPQQMSVVERLHAGRMQARRRYFCTGEQPLIQLGDPT